MELFWIGNKDGVAQAVEVHGSSENHIRRHLHVKFENSGSSPKIRKS